MPITVTELAKRGGVSPQYIRQLIDEGRIKATKFGPVWMISDDEARRWLDSRPGQKK